MHKENNILSLSPSSEVVADSVCVFGYKKRVPVSIFRQKGRITDSVSVIRYMERVHDCLHLSVERKGIRLSPSSSESECHLYLHIERKRIT
jgi:hypothetical protein